ncbi:MAG: hypothetical protein GY749_31600 [Desulfobacteraceae bacterium]|nr:hypothetical protein [Desulfobacteraceae bacterium]
MSRLFTIIKYLFLLIPVFAAIAVFIISNGNLSVTALVFVISGGFEGLYYMATRNLEEQARKNFNESVDENYVKLKKDNSVF